jgi:hypothetical protein
MIPPKQAIPICAKIKNTVYRLRHIVKKGIVKRKKVLKMRSN